ncbi:MAG TPA: carboxypeptidase regulatory-like domain-containing protein [bacterium]|nr:carboxypeptidase regulatory-like domain-containing protein [bacterium]
MTKYHNRQRIIYGVAAISILLLILLTGIRFVTTKLYIEPSRPGQSPVTGHAVAGNAPDPVNAVPPAATPPISSVVSGTVFDGASDTALPNCDITAENSRGTVIRGSSDSRGAYSLDLPRGTWILTARREHYGIRTVSLTIRSRNPVHQDFFLLQEASIFGNVTYVGGTPARDIRITVRFPGCDARILTATTDAGGHFDIGQVTPGHLMELRLSHPSGLRKIVSVDRFAPGQRRGPLDIVLETGCTLSGRVISAGDHTPVAGAVIRLNHENTDIQGIARTETDAGGLYMFHHVPQGRIRLDTCSGSHWHSRQTIHAPVSGDVTTVNFELYPPATLHGTVRTPRGDPMEGVMLRLRDPCTESSGSGIVAESDAYGEFFFDVVTAPITDRSGFRIEYDSMTLPGVLLKDTLAGLAALQPGDRLDLEITIPLCNETLFGRVRDEDENAIAAAEITLRNTRGEDAARTVTNNSGDYAFTGVILDDCTRGAITAEADGFAIEERDLAAAIHTANGRRLDLQLKPGAGISGRVIDDRGTPLEGLIVSVTPADENLPGPGRFSARMSSGKHACASSQTGRFLLTELVPGAYRLHVESPEPDGDPLKSGGMMEPAYMYPQPVHPGDDTLEIVIPQGGTIVVTVISEATGAPVSDYSVTVCGLKTINGIPIGDRFKTMAVSDPGGRCIISNITFGDVSVAVTCTEPAGAGGTAAETIAFSPDASPRYLTLSIPSGRQAVAGRVVTRETGEPVAGCLVYLSPSGERSGEGRAVTAATREDGRFELHPEWPGDYDVRIIGVFNESEFTHSETVVLTDDSGELVFRVDTGAVDLYGEVIDTDMWRPVQNVKVTAGPELTGIVSYETHTDSRGLFRITGVSSGPLFIHCVHPEYRRKELQHVDGTRHGDAGSPLVIELERY